MKPKRSLPPRSKRRLRGRPLRLPQVEQSHMDILAFIHGFLESYIYSPDYLNSYPNSYEQVNMVDSVSTSDYTLTYCRPGNCLLLEGKPSPSLSRDCTWSTILTLVAAAAIMWR